MYIYMYIDLLKLNNFYFGESLEIEYAKIIYPPKMTIINFVMQMNIKL